MYKLLYVICIYDDNDDDKSTLLMQMAQIMSRIASKISYWEGSFSVTKFPWTVCMYKRLSQEYTKYKTGLQFWFTILLNDVSQY
jgi:peptide deformylase